MLYVWFKDSLSEDHIFEQLKTEGIYLGQVKDWRDAAAGGRSYKRWEEHRLILEATTPHIPDFPAGIVDRVTLQESIYRGFRDDGEYKAACATLTAFLSYDEGKPCQQISVLGPTVASVVTAFSLFRTGDSEHLELRSLWGKEPIPIEA